MQYIRQTHTSKHSHIGHPETQTHNHLAIILRAACRPQRGASISVPGYLPKTDFHISHPENHPKTTPMCAQAFRDTGDRKEARLQYLSWRVWGMHRKRGAHAATRSLAPASSTATTDVPDLDGDSSALPYSPMAADRCARLVLSSSTLRFKFCQANRKRPALLPLQPESRTGESQHSQGAHL